MKTLLTLIILLSTVPLPAQREIKDSNHENKKRPSTLLLMSIDYSDSCEKGCPDSKISILVDGTLVVSGSEDFISKQPRRTKLSQEQLNAVNKEVKRAKLSGLRSSYIDEKDGCRGIVSDYPWMTISVAINGKKTRAIKHYLGCISGTARFNRELAKLKRLESRIPEILSISLHT